MCHVCRLRLETEASENSLNDGEAAVLAGHAIKQPLFRMEFGLRVRPLRGPPAAEGTLMSIIHSNSDERGR